MYGCGEKSCSIFNVVIKDNLQECSISLTRPRQWFLGREFQSYPNLKAFMEKSSEAGDVTSAAETAQFDDDNLTGEEKCAVFMP